MNPLQTVLLAVGLVVVLWLAYKIGKVVLRIAAGLAFLALIAALAWYFFLRSQHSTFHPTRSQHGSHFLFPLRSQAR